MGSKHWYWQEAKLLRVMDLSHRDNLFTIKSPFLFPCAPLAAVGWIDASPFGKGCKAWGGKDLWHMRSLLATEPVDFVIGNTYGKYLERDIGTPLIRIGFPIMDRHHHHRFPVWGYQGSLNVLVKILDKIFDNMDSTTNVPGKTDYSYDIIR